MELKPGYKPTDVGVIPEEWAVRSLGEIGEPLIGLTYKPSNVKSDGLLVLRSSNVADGALRFDDNVFVDMDVPNKIIARKGDILICVRNGSRDLIGKCAKIDDRAEGMTFGAFMAVLRTPFHDFVYYQFQSEVIQRQIHEHLGATINQITNRSLRSFRIPFPDDESEQRAIAGALGDVDALLGALTQLIAKKRDLKQGAMQQLLTGQTRLPGVSGEWEVKRLGDVAEVVMGQSPVGSSYNGSGFGVPLINGPTEFTDKHPIKIQWTSEPAKICKTGDLLLCVRGSSTGRMNLADDELCIGRGIAAIRAKSEADTTFITFQVSGAIQSILAATTGSTFPNIDGKSLRAIEIRLPPLPEQTAIATVLSDMDAELAALEQRLAKTRALKQGMMQELLTGRTRLV